MNKVDVIVTRHSALVAYLIEIGVADASTPVLAHVADPDQIARKHVAGVLPIRLGS